MEDDVLAEKFRVVVEAVVNNYKREFNLRVSNTSPQKLSKAFGQNQPVVTHPTARFIISNWDEIAAFDEFNACCEFALENHNVISEFHSEDIGRPLGEINWILKNFVKDVLMFEPGDLAFSEDHFQEVYNRYRRDLLSESLLKRFFICLQGLTLENDISEVEIDQKSTLRRIEPWDKKLIRDIPAPESVFVEVPDADESWHPIGPKLKYVFEITNEIPKSEIKESSGPIGDPTPARPFLNFVTALQLTNETESVNFASRFSPMPGVWNMGGGGGHSLEQPVVWDAAYELKQDDLDDIRHLYSLLQSKDFQNIETDLRMAIDQFHSGAIRSDRRVALSDMIVILEGLLKRKEEQYLGRRKLAQRVAILLGNSQEERERIYEDIKELYEKRSSIWGVAHGGGKKEFEEADTVLKRAKAYASDCLIVILELENDFGGLGEIRKSMKEEIDQGMLNIEFPKES